MSSTAERLREILQKNNSGKLTVIQASPKACWLDGQDCPYGQPYGQFRYRPTVFCIIPTRDGSGCTKLLEYSDDLDHVGGGFIESEIERRIDERVEEKQVKFDGEVRAVADELDDPAEKETLKLAADIIERVRLYHKMVWSEDI